MTDDELAMAWLKRRIELLSERQPMWSRNAYTHTRTTHVAFANGAVKVEGERAVVMGGTALELAEATFAAVKAYRAPIAGPVLLTWRCEPEIRRDTATGVQVYCRLALEPDLWS